MAKLIVCCKLPNGLIIEHPANPDLTVTLNGLNSSVIVGAPYATTEVEEGFWNEWISANSNFPAVESGAIFAVKNDASAKAAAKEREDQETGFEPMRTDGKDKRAKGVKPAAKDE